MHIFASRLNPEMDTDTLRTFLKASFNRDVKCKKITAVTKRHSSFHVTIECHNSTELYDPAKWPAGVLVKRFIDYNNAADTLEEAQPLATPGERPSHENGEKSSVNPPEGASETPHSGS